jgi:hypothetical protein
LCGQKYHDVALIPTSASPLLPFHRLFHPRDIQFEESAAIEKAAAVDAAGVDAMENEHSDGAAKKTFYEKELTPEIRASYEDMCAKVLPPHRAGDSPVSIVFNYDDRS